MKSKQALKTIKNIGLHHLAHYDEDDYDNGSINSYEEYDGTIKENYPDEIKAIEKELKAFEFLKSHLDIEIEDDTLYIEGGAITITPLHPREEKLLKEVFKK